MSIYTFGTALELGISIPAQSSRGVRFIIRVVLYEHVYASRVHASWLTYAVLAALSLWSKAWLSVFHYSVTLNASMPEPL